MDFVYDKPIFTQWTFAPAENCKGLNGEALTKCHNKARKVAQGAAASRTELPFTADELIGKLKTVFKNATDNQQQSLEEIADVFAINRVDSSAMEKYYNKKGKKLNSYIKKYTKKNEAYRKTLKIIFYELLSVIGTRIKNKNYDEETKKYGNKMGSVKNAIIAIREEAEEERKARSRLKF